ncbi:hypothetical protein [Rhizobium lusitanum]|uniref:hypothetical protein n=1 Tax=Rhizobium lusitanum TaxID=293958 RepID=UPI003159F201
MAYTAKLVPTTCEQRCVDGTTILAMRGTSTVHQSGSPSRLRSVTSFQQAAWTTTSLPTLTTMMA